MTTAVVRIWRVEGPKSLARALKVQPTSTPKPPCYRRGADRSCCLVRLSPPGRRATGVAPGAARGATDAREVRDRWPAVQNVQRPGLAHPRGAPARETPPAKGAPVAAPAPVVGGTDQADGPPPPAEGRVRARRDRGGASRSPVVAQAVRPAATGTPVGAGSRRGLARDPCPRAAFELRQPADGLQPGGERIAGADVEARGEAVVEDSVAPPGK
jgi:hypothetical protein